LDAQDLDALIYPVDPAGAARHDSIDSTCVLSSTSLVPALAFLAGYSSDEPARPIGLELLGRKNAEPLLIAMAYAYEVHTRKRTPPRLTSIIATPEDLPDMDIVRFNQLRAAFGNQSFEQVLRDNPSDDLTPERFQTIARQEIEKAGLNYLLGPTAAGKAEFPLNKLSTPAKATAAHRHITVPDWLKPEWSF
jgi:hypothetical protein